MPPLIKIPSHQRGAIRPTWTLAFLLLIPYFSRSRPPVHGSWSKVVNSCTEPNYYEITATVTGKDHTVTGRKDDIVENKLSAFGDVSSLVST